MALRLPRRLAVMSGVVLIVSAILAGTTSAANAYNATCTFSPTTVTASFTASGRTATYYWVWRTGMSVIDYGSATLASGATGSDTGSVPGSITLTSSSVVKLGIVKAMSTNYSYVTCTATGFGG